MVASAGQNNVYLMTEDFMQIHGEQRLHAKSQRLPSMTVLTRVSWYATLMHHHHHHLSIDVLAIALRLYHEHVGPLAPSFLLRHSQHSSPISPNLLIHRVEVVCFLSEPPLGFCTGHRLYVLRRWLRCFSVGKRFRTSLITGPA